MSTESEGTEPATEGKMWVCTACGKTSRTRYGFLANGERVFPTTMMRSGKRVSMMGWDESCMMNAVLYSDTQLVCNESGRVTEVKIT